MSIPRTELLARARSALHFSTVYRLGGGEQDPDAGDPRDKQNSCDCSSFICWALGIKKFERGRKWLESVNGGWFSTDGLWWDAVKTELGLFDLVGWIEGTWQYRAPGHTTTHVATAAKPGDLIVYPAAWVVRAGAPTRHAPANVPVGHVALITDPIPDKETGQPLVIDCSSGNWNNHGDAIREHRWLPRHPAAVVARCTLVVD